jgi:Cft2 family RNA processing exonuclease
MKEPMKNPFFLGSGSAFNSEKQNTCVLFPFDDGELLMFDCGETVFAKLNMNDSLSVYDKIHVFITHNHSDHVGSLASLVYWCYYNKVEIHVYGHESVFDLLRLNGVYDRCFQKHVYDKDEIYSPVSSEPSLRIKPILTEHVPSLVCFGLGVKSDHVNFYYSGDAKSIPVPVLTALETDGLDRLYQDCSWLEYDDNPHLSYKRLCEKITSQTMRSKVWLMHTDAGFNYDKAKADGFNIVMPQQG